mmetsp:Transcript_26752/g.61641  ORF Transcript_26752/g.61641 Transcript_26752/m.61641 type:complete len:273 (-) Transcript_26752:18-836(-)
MRGRCTKGLLVRLDVLTALDGATGLDEVQGLVVAHDDEGEDALHDDVQNGVGDDLEAHREAREALREQPHDGVEAPGDDDQPRDLGVQVGDKGGAGVLGSLTEGLGHGEQDGHKQGDGEKEPEPLHGGDHGDGTHVGAHGHADRGTHHGRNGHEVNTGDEAQVQDDQRVADDPVDVAGVEELAATSNGSPALVTEHSKVRKGGDTNDEGVGEEELPLGDRRLCGLEGHHNGAHEHRQKGNGQSTNTSGPNNLDLSAGLRRRSPGILQRLQHG